jgi:acetyl/propionyl-CoA carboxylase alpha subunit
MKYVATIDDHEYVIEIQDEHHVCVDGVIYDVDLQSVEGQPIHSLLVNGKSYEAFVYAGDDSWQVMLSGRLYPVRVEDEREKRMRMGLGKRSLDMVDFHLKSPMPGLVVSVPVSEGQQVAKGDVLVILESMKMQNELKSPRAGTVTRLRVKVGDSVEQKETLLSVV